MPLFLTSNAPKSFAHSDPSDQLDLEGSFAAAKGANEGEPK